MELLAFSHQMVIHCTITQAQLKHNVVLNFHCATNYIYIYIYIYIHTYIAAAAAAKSLQSCLTLCDPRDGSPPGSTAPGILQARTLEWVAISFSNAWKWKVKVKSLSCVWLRDPMDCSPPGSSIHGIFQGWVLEWGTIAIKTFSYSFPWFITGYWL